MAARRSAGARLSSRAGDVRDDAELEGWFARAEAASGDPVAALAIARDLGSHAPLPASGSTAGLWSILATIAVADVEVARIVEPQLDAIAILAEAHAVGIVVDGSLIGVDDSSTWGVFAAESGGMRLDAVESNGRWMLSGTKPWCSLASRLTHALVTAHTSAGRALFAVDLRTPAVTTHDERWIARGMSGVPSAPVDFDGVGALAVGGVGWYLERAGFGWGGLGVAAIWWGGAVGLAREMFDAAGAREPDSFALAHLGAVDVAIETTRAALVEAASRIDHSAADTLAGGRAMTDVEARRLAGRGRAIAARCVETVLDRSARSLGPAPLVLDERFARRHADLGLYVRQHHAERDDAALGRMIMEEESAPW